MDLLRTEETYVAEQMDTDQDGARFVEMIQNCNQTEGLLIKRLLYRWVEHFAALHPVLLQIPQYSWCVVKAMAYINMHRSVAITVEEISAYVNVSKSTLTKHFRQELNRTVVEYIYEVVMAEACRLLCGTRKTVAEISNQLGFCDAFYFSRRFSERYGIPPRDYSKQPLL
jgi:AraC-like DNA-binding protein